MNPEIERIADHYKYIVGTETDITDPKPMADTLEKNIALTIRAIEAAGYAVVHRLSSNTQDSIGFQRALENGCNADRSDCATIFTAMIDAAPKLLEE